MSRQNRLNQFLARNRIIVIVFIVLGLVVLLSALLTKRVRTVTIHIYSDDGAILSIAKEKGGLFEEVGKTSIDYPVSDPGVYYIRANKGRLETIKTLDLTTITKPETEIRLPLTQTVPVKRVSFGSLFDLLVEDKFVFGINPNSLSPGYLRLGEEYPDFSSISVPRIKKAIWLNHNNYLAKTLLNKVIWIRNGQTTPIPSYKKEGLSVIDFAKATDGFLLLTGNGIYKFDGNNKISKLVDENFSPEAKIFSDADYIYVGDLLREENKTINENELEDRVSSGSLVIYDHSGLPVGPKNQISSETSANSVACDKDASRCFVIASGKMVYIDTKNGKTKESSYYFLRASDVVVYKGHVLVLTDNGLWLYNSDNDDFRLLTSISPDEKYVLRSLTTYNTNSKIYFSTLPTDRALGKNQLNTVGAIYELAL